VKWQQILDFEFAFLCTSAIYNISKALHACTQSGRTHTGFQHIILIYIQHRYTKRGEGCRRNEKIAEDRSAPSAHTTQFTGTNFTHAVLARSSWCTTRNDNGFSTLSSGNNCAGSEYNAPLRRTRHGKHPRKSTAVIHCQTLQPTHQTSQATPHR
jgi:hypothetical protein